MALQYFPNRLGPLLLPGGGLPGLEVPIAYTNRTMDAAGESVFSIGLLFWADGGTHTVSSAGGKLFTNFGTTTFANGSTNVRAGIQDVTVGLEDLTFDVYDDLVGGTDPLTAGLYTITFSTGTKSIAHLANVAIGFEMTARGGADSVIVRSIANTVSNFPYMSVDSGASPARVATMLPVAIQADDGTIGWILGCPIPYIDDTTAISDTTTPDEVALLFTLEGVSSLQIPMAYAGAIVTSDNLEFRLYSDPLGTPVEIESGELLGINNGQSANMGTVWGALDALVDPAVSTLYALAVRGTGTSFNLSRMTIGDAALRAALAGGTNWRMGTRSNDTGAFAETTTILPRIGFHLSKIDDGAGGGTTIVIANQMPLIVGGRGGVVGY
jgi:hypothetical protein